MLVYLFLFAILFGHGNGMHENARKARSFFEQKVGAEETMKNLCTTGFSFKNGADEIVLTSKAIDSGEYGVFCSADLKSADGRTTEIGIKMSSSDQKGEVEKLKQMAHIPTVVNCVLGCTSASFVDPNGQTIQYFGMEFFPGKSVMKQLTTWGRTILDSEKLGPLKTFQKLVDVNDPEGRSMRAFYQRAIDTAAELWANGWNHNDLHVKNMMYDHASQQFKIIDADSCKQMASGDVNSFLKGVRADLDTFTEFFVMFMFMPDGVEDGTVEFPQSKWTAVREEAANMKVAFNSDLILLKTRTEAKTPRVPQPGPAWVDYKAKEATLTEANKVCTDLPSANVVPELEAIVRAMDLLGGADNVWSHLHLHSDPDRMDKLRIWYWNILDAAATQLWSKGWFHGSLDVKNIGIDASDQSISFGGTGCTFTANIPEAQFAKNVAKDMLTLTASMLNLVLPAGHSKTPADLAKIAREFNTDIPILEAGKIPNPGRAWWRFKAGNAATTLPDFLMAAVKKPLTLDDRTADDPTIKKLADLTADDPTIPGAQARLTRDDPTVHGPAVVKGQAVVDPSLGKNGQTVVDPTKKKLADLTADDPTIPGTQARLTRDDPTVHNGQTVVDPTLVETAVGKSKVAEATSIQSPTLQIVVAGVIIIMLLSFYIVGRKNKQDHYLLIDDEV